MTLPNPYTDPRRVRAALQALGLRPNRGMGQNFLIDQNALDSIVTAAGVRPDEVVVEVGPGLGVLTWELLQRAGRVLAVELDKRLAERLPAELRDPHLTIIQGDILSFPPERLLTGLAGSDGTLPPYKLVANLPYAITSPVLRHFLEASFPPQLLVVLVQWEVAERITAAPGDLSLLAHAIQIFAEPEVVTRVPAASFLPPPQVDSAVLRLRVRPVPLVERDEVEALFRTIKAGFLQTRKQLGNALPLGLRSLGLSVERDQVLAALAAATINPVRRAETLTIEEWMLLHRALARYLPYPVA